MEARITSMTKREKGCLRKIRYASHIQAKIAAQYWEQRYGTPQQPYRCQWCLGFHLTRVKEHAIP
jgi:hypothetical protein